MTIQYEIKNEVLNDLIDNKAKELCIGVEKLIWCYINRGLMDDAFNIDVFNRLHSEEFLKEVNDALGLD